MGNNCIDELGNRYERLLVVRKADSYKKGRKTLSRWHCMCDCGNEYLALGWTLRAGAVKSCGCLRDERAIENCKLAAERRRGLPALNQKNEIGNRFGLLTVVSALPTKHKRSRWLSKCDCGRSKRATGDSLRSGKVQSCGCLRTSPMGQLDQGLPKYHTNVSVKFTDYVSRSKRNGLDFTLTLEEFQEILCKPCTYCGELFDRMGVDRLDNSLGYTLINSAPCCVVCNRMKLTASYDQFIDKCKKIVENHKK